MARNSKGRAKMITPEYLDQVSRSTESAVSKVDELLIQKIAKRILDGFNFYGEVVLIPSTVHDLKKLMAHGFSLGELEKIIEDELPTIEEAVAEAFRVSASEISNTTTAMMNTILDLPTNSQEVITKAQLEGVPNSAKDLNLTIPEIRQIESAYRRTKGTVRNLTLSTAGNANQAYLDACDSAYMKIKAGMSPNTAIMEAIDEMARKGVTTVDYPSGRKDRVEVAVARAVRTGVNQANADVILTRCAELGIGYVKVSAHLGARVTKKDDYTNHAWWQGKVYQLDYTLPELSKYADWASEGMEQYDFLAKVRARVEKTNETIGRDYPDFVETCGYGNMLGICGINCRHTFNPFIPNKFNANDETVYDYDENEKRYKQTQKLRAYERKLRELKRRIEAFKPMKGNSEADKVIQALNREYNAVAEEYIAYAKANGINVENWRRAVALPKPTTY